MKRVVALMLLLSLLFSAVGCAVSEAPSISLEQDSGSISFSLSQSQEASGEYPPPDTSGSAGESASAAQSGSSSASASSGSSSPGSSSSKPESSSSSKPESSSSSKPAGSSSSKPESSSSSKPESSSSSKPESSSSSKPESSSSSKPESSSSSKPESSSSSKPESGDAGIVAPTSDEWRAVWLSYLDIYSWLANKTRAQFTAAVQNAFDKIAKAGLNTVIVQVRPFGDALYDSDIYPVSYLFRGTEGGSLPYDALSIMVQEAHSRDLEIEAWINPYRVRQNATRPMSADNPAKKLLDAGDSAVFEYNGGVWYNPGSATARKLIVDGVAEIVQNYDVDGIHFDDYFYGTTDLYIDDDLYREYQENGGTMTRANWRRNNVTMNMKDCYDTIKAIDPTVRFGISPQGNNDANYNAQYADVATWCATAGYVDYICPQIYWGFDHAQKPFSETLAFFNRMIKTGAVKLYAGLAAYKIGTVDSYAGAGKNEWIDSRDILAAQVQDARENSRYGGFALFRYEFCFNPSSTLKSRMTAEMSALSALLD